MPRSAATGQTITAAISGYLWGVTTGQWETRWQPWIACVQWRLHTRESVEVVQWSRTGRHPMIENKHGTSIHCESQAESSQLPRQKLRGGRGTSSQHNNTMSRRIVMLVSKAALRYN